METSKNIPQELYDQLREYKNRKRESEGIFDYDGVDYWNGKIKDLLTNIEKEKENNQY